MEGWIDLLSRTFMRYYPRQPLWHSICVTARLDQDMPIKVAIVEDDEGIRSSLGALIRRAPALRLAGDYPDAESAIREIPRRPPDVVLMDINLPGLNGVECVRQLKSVLPADSLLLLSPFEAVDSLFKSLKSGSI